MQETQWKSIFNYAAAAGGYQLVITTEERFIVKSPSTGMAKSIPTWAMTESNKACVRSPRSVGMYQDMAYWILVRILVG